MAIETLKGKNEIGGYGALHHHLGKTEGDFDREDCLWPIAINHDSDCLSFRIQNGPIKENGLNGCQVDTLLHAAREIINGLDNKFPCPENKEAVMYLGHAIRVLESRKKDRQQRGVEGTSQK